MRKFQFSSFLCMPLFIFIASHAYCADETPKNYALLLGEPTNVKFINYLSNEQRADDMLGDWYEVKMKNIEPIKGVFTDKEITVRLIATHKDILESAHKIYMFIDVGQQPYTVVYWREPVSIACLPKRLIEDVGMASEFSIYDSNSQELCVPAEWFN